MEYLENDAYVFKLIDSVLVKLDISEGRMNVDRCYPFTKKLKLNEGNCLRI